MVSERSFEGNGYDFHVAVRMQVESGGGVDGVVVQNPEGTEVDPLRVVVICKAEGMGSA